MQDMQHEGHMMGPVVSRRLAHAADGQHADAAGPGDGVPPDDPYLPGIGDGPRDVPGWRPQRGSRPLEDGDEIDLRATLVRRRISGNDAT